MSVVEEGIRIEANGTLSFGNYSVTEKKKVSNFEDGGDIYKVKTHDQVTRLEKNGRLLFESVPGSSVHKLKLNEKTVLFSIEGFEETTVTMELEPEKEYKIIIDDMNVGSTKANLSGKINFSIELKQTPQTVKIEKL